MTVAVVAVLALAAALSETTSAQKPVSPPSVPATTVIKSNYAVAAGDNVRIEVTLSDLGGNGAAPTTKSVTITTNDGHWGKLRAAVTSRLYGSAPLNIDARPWVLGDGRITVELTIEYNQGRNPDVDGNPDRIVGVSINQSTTVVLQNGKPQLISQSADPIGDRKVSVEVKATILRN